MKKETKKKEKYSGKREAKKKRDKEKILVV